MIRETSHVVAVIDDDYRLLEALENLLISAGFDSLLYSSGDHFFAAEVLHKIACIVSDIDMPGMNGIELLTNVRAMTPEMPVILMSAHHSLLDPFTYTDTGANFYLSKPFDSGEMVRAIRTSINSK